MEIFAVILVLSVAIGYWANSWGRNPWGWGIASFLLSPLLTAIVLLFCGKTLQKQAEEANTLNSLINK